MQNISEDPAVVAAAVIPGWTNIDERECLARLSRTVPEGGSILEIGCLYGCMTAVLALANPTAGIHSIDDFSWTPPGYPTSTPELMQENLRKLGVRNVTVQVGDSREIGKNWDKPIDLLWIDGGHSYEFVKSDLTLFGPEALVIALHDYDNPAWPSVRRAVEEFIAACDGRVQLTEVVGTVAVLRWA